MILGIGIDLVEIDRIKKICDRWESHFTSRVFTEKELDYCNKKKNCYQSLAGRFAAKEAMFKALGTGWAFGMHWKEIEVVNDELGKPSIVLSGKAARFADKLGLKDSFVSLSHTKQFVMAQVILTK